MKKWIGYTVLTLAILLGFSLAAFPQMTNALTRAALQVGTFTLSGVYKFTGATFLPAGASNPATCDATVTGARRFFLNTAENALYACTATNTWTSVSAGLANPFTANQTFSGTVDFTGTTAIKRQQRLEVCKSGCTYSTIQSAVDAITDATTTKRYTIYVHPGEYDEVVTVKSYISVVGANAATVRIGATQSGGGAGTVAVPQGATEFEFRNVSILGQGVIRWNGDDTAARTTSYWYNNILGNINPGPGEATSIDCWNDSGGRGHIIYAYGNTCRTSWDATVLRSNTTFYDDGTVYELKTGNAISVYRISAHGAQIYSRGAQVVGDSVAGGVNVVNFDSFLPITSSTLPTIVSIKGLDVNLTNMGAGGGNQSACLKISSSAAYAPGTTITMDDVSCRISSSAGAQVRGIYVSSSDADHSTWSVHWNGGRIELATSGTLADVSNSDSAMSAINLTNIVHVGNYSGSVAPLVADTRSGRFATSLFGPSGDLVVGTCLASEWKLDTAGATKELCLCDPGNTWNCVALAAGGPVD